MNMCVYSWGKMYGYGEKSTWRYSVDRLVYPDLFCMCT